MYVHAITGLCLIILWLYWMISAASVKPIQQTKGWLSGNGYSISYGNPLEQKVARVHN